MDVVNLSLSLVLDRVRKRGVQRGAKYMMKKLFIVGQYCQRHIATCIV